VLVTGTGRWYALYTRARHEKVVDRLLRARGVQSFLPLHRVLSQWKDRRKWIRIPLFPGYLFARLHKQDLWRAEDVRGVVSIVGNREGPTPVPENQVDAVRRMLEKDVPIYPLPYVQDIKAGQRVRVLSGPLIGVEGVVAKDGKKHRLVVSLHLLGRSVATYIDAEAIEII
jgi:transcription antitermination factor NusG